MTVDGMKSEAIKQPVSWCLLDDHLFQRLNVIDGCPVSEVFIAGFTSLSNPEILNSELETEVHEAPSLGVYEKILLEKLKLDSFGDCTLTMWRGPVRHQLKGGTCNSHHHEVWRLCLIRNNATGEGHLWPIGRDTDFVDSRLDLDLVRSTSPGEFVVWLDISDLGLEALPEEVGQMRHLRKLECHSNLLTELPGHLCGPEGGPAPPLEYISLNENRLETVTPRLKELGRLKWLSLNGNRLASIPDLPPSVERLSLHCNLIAALPESLACEGALLACSLHGNKIAEIPPRFFAGLKVINTFSLMRNQIKTIPDTVGDMAELMDFWLYTNELTSLPAALGRLSKLKRFWVDRNALEALPDAIGKCTALEQFYASDNRLAALPASLARCTRLVRLSVDGNLDGCLESVPEMHRDKLVPGSVKPPPMVPPRGEGDPALPLPREPGAYPSLLRPDQVGTSDDWIARTAQGAGVREDRFSIVVEARPVVSKGKLPLQSLGEEDTASAAPPKGLMSFFSRLSLSK